MVDLPDALERRVCSLQREGESFSAVVARLLEHGVRAAERKPRYIGAGDGPTDLGRRAEEYLRELVEAH
jgi:hypothetical protein